MRYANRTSLLWFAATAALPCAFSLAVATAAPDPADDDREHLRRSTQRAVRENCLICHSDDLIRTQRLSPKQWTAEVDKMLRWGAPLPPELREPVIAYLAAEYAAGSAPPRLDVRPLGEFTRPALANVAHQGDSARGEVLYARNCANCHGKDGLGLDLGPNLVEKPVLLSEQDYTNVVRKGERRMPGFAAALDPKAEADILAWLRTRRYEPTPAVAR